MSFKIITDSCCDLPAQMVSDLDLGVVALSVEMDGRAYAEGEMTPKELYDHLRGQVAAGIGNDLKIHRKHSFQIKKAGRLNRYHHSRRGLFCPSPGGRYGSTETLQGVESTLYRTFSRVFPVFFDIVEMV